MPTYVLGDLLPHPVEGCEGFGPASLGWVTCRCWRVELTGDGDIVIHGKVRPPTRDEIATVNRRLREVVR